MKTTWNTISLAGGLITLAFMYIGCTQEPARPASELESLSGFFTPEQPQQVLSILQARATTRPGDTVTVAGQIGGTKSPFTEGYAAFVIADESLVFCSENPDENCSTPWDACCEAPEKVLASRAVVQFLGEDGRPVPTGFRGAQGLRELDHVIVSGVVNTHSTPDNLIIDARRLYQP